MGFYPPEVYPRTPLMIVNYIVAKTTGDRVNLKFDDMYFLLRPKNTIIDQNLSRSTRIGARPVGSVVTLDRRHHDGAGGQATRAVSPLTGTRMN